MQRRFQPPWLRRFAMAFVGLWGLGMGCNPALINAIGGNPIETADTPDGYIMILLMNLTDTAINTQIDIRKQNGALSRQTLSVGPLLPFAFANDCDVASIQVVNFGFASPGGVVTTPSNLGTIRIGQGINCGSVLAITASGAPPTFSVQVY